MKSLFRHIRTFIFRGLLAIVPLALSFFSLKILYTTLDKRAKKAVNALRGTEGNLCVTTRGGA